jgi:membrane associated rhomboid family serine protease
MESTVDLIIIALIVVISFSSWKGLNDSRFFERYVFEVDPILIDKQYYRILSPGFLHLSWMHLIFNMIALYTFGGSVGMMLGVRNFLLLYFVSLVAGNLLALFIHRNHGDYSAAGASGAISGVMFACILFFPDANIGFPFIPELSIRAWVFGVLYLLVSIYGIKNKTGNIGHEAHVGGAIAGILTALALMPELLWEEPWLVAALLVPFTVFMVLIVTKPEVLLIDGYWGFQQTKSKPLKKSLSDEEQLNILLDKMGSRGIEALSKSDRNLLEKLSQKHKAD